MYAKEATKDFIEAVRGNQLAQIAWRLQSRVFRDQVAGYFKSRWAKASEDEILADLKNNDGYAPTDELTVFVQMARANAIELIPLPVLKRIPQEEFQRYSFRIQRNRVEGYETLLSALLRQRKMPDDYSAYIKSIPNLPSYSLNEPLSRKVVDDIPGLENTVVFRSSHQPIIEP